MGDVLIDWRERLFAHLRSLGPAWTHLTAVPILLYTAYIVGVRGEYRWELMALFLAVAITCFASRRTRRLYEGMYPMFLTAVFYDSMRFAKNVGVSLGRVHVCDLRQLELALFGFTSGGAPVTLQDYFLAHSSPWLDLYCAIPYGSFLYVSVLFATYLYFKDYVLFQRYTWSFLILNLAAYVTYHVYPAAPPWYYHAHGCAVDLEAAASAGPHLTAVDAMIGYKYFGAFYGRSADVFGAVPSLHVAYPLLIVLDGWAYLRARGRTLALMFAASMVFAAVYLDHHWVIDVLIGLSYCVGVHVGLRFVFARRALEAVPAAVVGLADSSAGTPP